MIPILCRIQLVITPRYPRLRGRIESETTVILTPVAPGLMTFRFSKALVGFARSSCHASPERHAHGLVVVHIGTSSVPSGSNVPFTSRPLYFARTSCAPANGQSSSRCFVPSPRPWGSRNGWTFLLRSACRRVLDLDGVRAVLSDVRAVDVAMLGPIDLVPVVSARCRDQITGLPRAERVSHVSQSRAAAVSLSSSLSDVAVSSTTVAFSGSRRS